jgi:hypothetical protein
MRTILCLIIILTCTLSHAASIDTTSAWTGDWAMPFGNGTENTATYGAVITAIGTTLNSFTFYLGQEQNLSSTPFIYTAYVYAWDGQKAQGPELWHSDAMTIPTALQPVTFTPSLHNLSPGASYALFISVSAHYTSNDTEGAGLMGLIWDGATSQTHFVSFNNHGDTTSWTSTVWDNALGSSHAPAMTADFSSTLSLSSGWNLISFPFQPTNNAIASVLADITTSYAIVWGYASTWTFYDPASPSGSTLTTLDAGKGYWIKTTEAKTLPLSGTTPSSSVSLSSGWNLVGFNGTACIPVSTAFAGLSGNLQIVWGYAASTWQFYDPNAATGNTLEQLCPGYGYWVKADP